MSKRSLSSVLSALVLTSVLSECYSLNHTVGKGAQGHEEETKRVWFALWGLVPVTDFDSQELAGDAKDYTVETKAEFVDVLLNLLTGWVTFYSPDGEGHQVARVGRTPARERVD